MFGSETVEVGIGMSFLFLFMSLIATSLRELIESFAKTRAIYLEKGIKELLQSSTKSAQPGANAAVDIVKTLYEHPLITSLYEGDYKTGTRSLPSYMPRESFALAFLDIVTKASENGKPLSMDTLLDDVRRSDVPDPLKRVVLTAIATADNDLKRVRATIENWFDHTMTRVSGWYSRQSGWILGGIGLLAAAAFNVDAITVAQHLVQDKTLRESVVAQAKSYADTPANAPGQDPQSSSQAIKAIGDIDAKLNQVGLPIGWYRDSGGLHPRPQACGVAAGDTLKCDRDYNPIFMFFGWLITGFAIMLGAPFWFDMLNKLTDIRSTMKGNAKGSATAQLDAAAASAPAPAPAGAAGDQALTALADATTMANASAAAALAAAQGLFEPHLWSSNPNGPQAGLL